MILEIHGNGPFRFGMAFAWQARALPEEGGIDMIERDVIVCLRLTREEYGHVCKKADEDGETRRRDGARNLSAYMRKCVLRESGYRDRAMLERELHQLAFQVRKIGVNVNQATKKINSGYWNRDTVVGLREGLAQVGREMGALTRAVREAWDGDHETSKH